MRMGAREAFKLLVLQKPVVLVPYERSHYEGRPANPGGCKVNLPMLGPDIEEEIVDGEVCWDPDEGIISMPYEPQPAEYKVYETIQGKLRVTDLNGDPLFAPHRPREGLFWNPLTEKYERDPRYRAYAFGRQAGKSDRVKDELKDELDAIMKNWFPDLF